MSRQGKGGEEVNILICFAKGFGYLTLGIALFAVIVSLFAMLHKMIVAKTGWDSDNVGLSILGIVVFLAVGTIMSLSICGIIK